jgi:hypothetical protein
VKWSNRIINQSVRRMHPSSVNNTSRRNYISMYVPRDTSEERKEKCIFDSDGIFSHRSKTRPLLNITVGVTSNRNTFPYKYRACQNYTPSSHTWMNLLLLYPNRTL